MSVRAEHAARVPLVLQEALRAACPALPQQPRARVDRLVPAADREVAVQPRQAHVHRRYVQAPCRGIHGIRHGQLVRDVILQEQLCEVDLPCCGKRHKRVKRHVRRKAQAPKGLAAELSSRLKSLELVHDALRHARACPGHTRGLEVKLPSVVDAAVIYVVANQVHAEIQRHLGSGTRQYLLERCHPAAARRHTYYYTTNQDRTIGQNVIKLLVSAEKVVAHKVVGLREVAGADCLLVVLHSLLDKPGATGVGNGARHGACHNESRTTGTHADHGDCNRTRHHGEQTHSDFLFCLLYLLFFIFLCGIVDGGDVNPIVSGKNFGRNLNRVMKPCHVCDETAL